ncbi:chromosome condensation protein CrcB, partial [Rhodococcus rhodochrous]
MALGGAAGVLCGAGVMNAVTALAGAPNFRGTFGAAFGAVDVLVQALPLFVVNVLGSFLLGLLWAASRRRGPDWRPRLVAGLGTGFLGAFTTISSAVALVLWPVRLGAAASGAGGVLAAA